MTYIDLINRFWAINGASPLSLSATSLYFYLLNVCSGQRWPVCFHVATSAVTAALGVSRPTYIAARGALVDAGLIEVECSPGRSDVRYRICGQPTGAESGCNASADPAVGVPEPADRPETDKAAIAMLVKKLDKMSGPELLGDGLELVTQLVKKFYKSDGQHVKKFYKSDLRPVTQLVKKFYKLVKKFYKLDDELVKKFDKLGDELVKNFYKLAQLVKKIDKSDVQLVKKIDKSDVQLVKKFDKSDEIFENFHEDTSFKNNDNIINYTVSSTTTRACTCEENEKFFDEYFSGKTDLTPLLMDLHRENPETRTVDDFKELARLVICEWEQCHREHDGYTDWASHLTAQVRIKNRCMAQHRTIPSNPNPNVTANTDRGPASDQGRQIRDESYARVMRDLLAGSHPGGAAVP